MSEFNPSVQGAWRLEEYPAGSPYGPPNTHWLFVGDRVKVCTSSTAASPGFTFRVRTYDDFNPKRLGIGDAERMGSAGYYEVDDDLLFLSFGKRGIRPPRFASDCGLFFAFTRDPAFPMPAFPKPSREPIDDDVFGRLMWSDPGTEWLGQWTGECQLRGGWACELSVSDYLAPIEFLLPTLKRVYEWLSQELEAVIAACAEKVFDWIDDLDELPGPSEVSRVAETIHVDAIHSSNRDVHLWAHTNIPIDHSIRVYLRIDDESIAVEDVAIEG
jgi:hypothetical protein